MNTLRKTPPGAKRLVWRITPDAPRGEWVNAEAIRAPKVDAPEEPRSNWAMSSFDLQYGAEIRDVSDTVPKDLLDQLFPAESNPAKTPGK
jgi:hypothetical protein